MSPLGRYSTRHNGDVTDEWEGGQRQGIRWGRVTATMLVVALVAGGVYAVRRERGLAIDTDNAPVVVASEAVEVVVTGPLEAGDRWYCPDTHPVRAYDDGLYYPVEYPRSGAHIARPDNCYVDETRAEEDGFRLAPLPAGATLAGGIYLMPTRAPTSQACRALAAEVGFTVPCPTHLPAPADGPTCITPRCEFEGGVIIEQRIFDRPEEWVADAHLVITAAPLSVGHVIRKGRPLKVDANEALVKCAPDDTVQAPPAPDFSLRECPSAPPWIPGISGYPHEEHTTAIWRRGRVVYAASLHGASDEIGRLLQVIIERIRYFEAT